MTYTQRVRDSILPLSVADTLPKAFEEWRFTGRTHDHEESIETCKLCARDAKRRLNKLMRKMRLDACIKALQRLARSEDSHFCRGLSINDRYRWGRPARRAAHRLWRDFSSRSIFDFSTVSAQTGQSVTRVR
jgi:hypothetical protein